MLPKISIITICYNEPQVRGTCESVASQTYKNYEWIVIDGGSGPDTLAVFDRYKFIMSHFVSEKDDGVYDAMNKGIRAATGEYIIFMNAGDRFYHNEVLARVVEFMESNRSDIIYGSVVTSGKGEIHSYIRVPVKDIQGGFFWFYGNLPHQGEFFRRELFDKFGYYRTDRKIYSDWIENLTFFRKGCSFTFVDTIIAEYNNEGISSMHKDMLPNLESALLHAEFWPEMNYLKHPWLVYLLARLKYRLTRDKKYRWLSRMAKRYARACRRYPAMHGMALEMMGDKK
ncbi:MAG: glycosyltransferase [Rickettsiales bacterium]|jgi:glycosyltransferase involved in cell wall biosynthesis|nr:glycosyltransferase [Rickettsiales bacterium]